MLKLKLQYFGHVMQRANSLEKSLILGKIEGRRRRGQQRMVGWHHQLDGRESEHPLGKSGGQGGLVCCSPWGRKESNMTQRLNKYFISGIHHFYSWLEYKVEGLPSADIIQVTSQSRQTI